MRAGPIAVRSVGARHRAICACALARSQCEASDRDIALSAHARWPDRSAKRRSATSRYLRFAADFVPPDFLPDFFMPDIAFARVGFAAATFDEAAAFARDPFA